MTVEVMEDEPVSFATQVDSEIERKVQAFIDENSEFGVSLESAEGGIVTIRHAKYGSIAIDLATGEIDTQIKPGTPIVVKLKEALGQGTPAPVTIDAMPANRSESDLTMDDVKRYICPEATDQEAYSFLKLCQARGLNPFTKEAYLVKYGSAAATTIVGKDAFTRRAEQHPKFDGFSAGIIVEDAEGTLDFTREGTFYVKGKEKLVGGWAEVWRTDRTKPFRMSVSMDEYDKKKSVWNSMPGTMIRKVALVGALREAFPSEFGGLYDSAEVEAV